MDDKNSNQLHIRFENVAAAEASRLATELKERLQTASNRISVELHKPNPNTLDLGSELILQLLQHDIPIALVAHLIVFFFQEKGGQVAIVIENTVTKQIVFRVKEASQKVEEELKKVLSRFSESSDKDDDDE